MAATWQVHLEVDALEISERDERVDRSDVVLVFLSAGYLESKSCSVCLEADPSFSWTPLGPWDHSRVPTLRP